MPEAKPGQVFMQFGHVNGVMGDAATEVVDCNVLADYKQTWTSIGKATSGEYKSTVKFKSWHSRPELRRVRTANPT